MEAEYQLTAEEAEKEMEQLRKVFTIVRLVDANRIQCLASGKPSSKIDCSCYCFWGKNKPCENCISAIASPFSSRIGETAAIRQRKQSLSF